MSAATDQALPAGFVLDVALRWPAQAWATEARTAEGGEMERNRHIARTIRRALLDSGLNGATIAFRAKVSRCVMARALCGDESLEFGELAEVSFHLGLAIEFVQAPEQPRVRGPVATVVDLAIERLRST